MEPEPWTGRKDDTCPPTDRAPASSTVRPASVGASPRHPLPLPAPRKAAVSTAVRPGEFSCTGLKFKMDSVKIYTRDRRIT